MTAYEPIPVQQGDGSPLQWKNCGCAVSATCLDRDTEGASTTTGGRVRQLTADSVGGTNLDQNDRALRIGWPPDDHLDVRHMLAFDDAVEMVAEGRGAHVQGAYPVFAGTIYDGSPGFRGNHSSYWNDVRIVLDTAGRIDYQASEAQWHDPLWDGRRKGIPTRRLRWIPLAMVRQFAADLVLSPGRTVGLGHCYIAFTRDTELATVPPVTAIDYGGNSMIVAGGLTLRSSHRMFLPAGTPLHLEPRATSPVVTRMAADGHVGYFGNAAPGWRAVLVKTGNFPDHAKRPVQVYVPALAGPVSAQP